ncbi:hypothetical protein L7F22_068651, partial [Adiantum nelumboides]|nr:hypothetical protein [Adiantum nelumboides]
MAKALEAHDAGLSLHKCSTIFGISRGAIANWEEGRTQSKQKGPPTVLTLEEEEALVQWVYLKSESGHGASVMDVKLKVAEICQERYTILINDETGFQGSRDKGMKVLAKKGTKPVYGITCDSREWMTVLCCVNAFGKAIPSYYIFKGSRINGNYVQNCELGAAMAVQRKAWMIGELFKAWLELFENAIMNDMGKENRHLLILDGHGSH